jgi:hypothetical protein
MMKIGETIPSLAYGTPFTMKTRTVEIKPVRYENVKLDVAETIGIDFNVSWVVGEKAVAANGRNSYRFITPITGRAPAGFQAAQIANLSGVFVSINGARPNQSAFYLDGSNNSQSNFNAPTYAPSLAGNSDCLNETSMGQPLESSARKSKRPRYQLALKHLS